MESWDLVGEFEDVFMGDGLIEEVRHAIHEAIWVERDYVWRRRDDVLRDAWSAFSEAVKYRTRYVIWLVDDVDEQELRDYGEVPPGKILHDVGMLLDRLGVVRTLPAGSTVWRAQTHEGDTLTPAPSAGRLGTAKREHAKQPNRMSPAGIPMFYGAMDLDTAIAEVAIHAPKGRDNVTVGRFSLSNDVTVVDFTALPATSSIFDPQLGRFRREITFLHEFVTTLRPRLRQATKPSTTCPRKY
ncbi:HEPN-associated N-terminal domain-containing protein [Saccharopolyspora sp. 5N102]|uniref:HEPN-associated N-terminal domain-containing protein n=1 Tax=Saccharopolyspora sp. 5N102 TaxID=3375155 RepID=UPI00379BAA74